MKTNASEGDMVRTLDEVNLKYGGNVEWNRFDHEGKRINFTLKVKSSKGLGARRGFSGRRMVSACWHVHGDFFDALFKVNPTAWVTAHSDRIDINGGNWQDRNIGSIMSPLMYSEACECSNHTFKTGKLELHNGELKETNVKIITQQNLSSECWLIQFSGKDACKTCEAKGTKECGGKNIIKTGKNEKGIAVPVG